MTHRLITVIALVFFAAISKAQQTTDANLLERELRLPTLTRDESCPVSVGATDVVSGKHGHIFGAGGHFIGKGPVYLALSWKPSERAEGRFDLYRVPKISEGFRLKTPWIMQPDYKCAALIRGERIDSGKRGTVLFSERGTHVSPTLILRSGDEATLISREQRERVDNLWGFWPSSMVLPTPGAMQFKSTLPVKLTLSFSKQRRQTSNDSSIFPATPAGRAFQ